MLNVYIQTDYFYNSCLPKTLKFLAVAFVYTVRFPGGTLSEQDLKAFQVRVSDAWSVQLGDYKMHFPPPPAGGAILSFILQLMHGRSAGGSKSNRWCRSWTTETAVAYEYSVSVCLSQGFGLSPASINGEQKKVTLHRYLEAVKFANGLKRNLGDPFFNSRDVRRLQRLKRFFSFCFLFTKNVNITQHQSFSCPPSCCINLCYFWLCLENNWGSA